MGEVPDGGMRGGSWSSDDQGPRSRFGAGRPVRGQDPNPTMAGPDLTAAAAQDVAAMASLVGSGSPLGLYFVFSN